MRRLHKSGVCTKPFRHWQWFQGEAHDDIRLRFEDERGFTNMFPTSQEEAYRMVLAFTSGECNVEDFRLLRTADAERGDGRM